MMQRRVVPFACAAALLVGCVGCPVAPSGPQSATDLPFLDEFNNASFSSATALPLTESDLIEFEGSVSSSADLDLYSLGKLRPGDSLFIDARPNGSDVDLTAAVFDSRELLHAYNDDREPDSSDLNPLLDFTIRGDADEYFLGIAPYFESNATGAYRVTVRITRGGGVPGPTDQIVFLDWDGGSNIVVENVGRYDLAPFDAADLGPTYAGRTEDMKDLVQQVIEANFADYNLTILNSDDHAVPAGPHSTVYFGARHPRAFAISQQIDTMNADLSDNTIVFTESYRTAFFNTPTFEQMGVALGNTVAHELGHLFGLVHTHDCTSLMDSTCSNSAILSPQRFKAAELADSVFPIGWQPAQEILEWVLGFTGLG